MRRVTYFPYLVLLTFLFFLLSLPDLYTKKVRHCVIASVSPPWALFSTVKNSAMSFLTLPTIHQHKSLDSKQKNQELERENSQLLSQLDNMREWLLNEDRIEEQLTRLKALATKEEQDPFWKSFFQRRIKETLHVLQLHIKSLPAKVVYREPSSWSSFLWINVGESSNRALGKIVIAKNSPVVIGNALVGLVEDVYTSSSRVRLITDSNLVPSVRVARGYQQNQLLLGQIETLSYMLEKRKDLFASPQEEQIVLDSLHRLQAKLKSTDRDLYLAKGELHGSSNPLWRSRTNRLHGIGFNYDFADEEGPSRDLRTGKPSQGLHHGDGLAIIQKGDVLITTGLDGIFPAGLQVAYITHVDNLREGACSYEIEAKSVVESLHDLSLVSVLPPTEFAK